MKELIRRFTKKQWIFAVLTVVSLILFTGLTIFVQWKKQALTDQQAAYRWAGDGDFAQVSCYFTRGNNADLNKILEFRYKIDKLLQEAAITAEKENTRLYIDSYSAEGTISIQRGKITVQANAVGVGGDFFFFHPVRLINGSYFSSDNIMEDYIIIDEETAWQLFGSSNVVGMSVLIGNVPHYVAGVVSREDGRLWEAAGLSQSVVYTSESTLSAYGSTEGILHYEVVMPNPVKGFAYTKIKEKFGYDEKQMHVVDNSTRYSLEPLLIILSEFGTRSMQHAAIQFPYWENYARGYEDIFATLLVIQIILIVFPVGVILVTAIRAWRRRTFTWRDVGRGITNRVEMIRDRLKEEKFKWKHF